MQGPRLRNLGCKMIWVNCMTFMFDYERRFFEEHGPADAMIYQSEFQRCELESQLQSSGYDPAPRHLKCSLSFYPKDGCQVSFEQKTLGIQRFSLEKLMSSYHYWGAIHPDGSKWIVGAIMLPTGTKYLVFRRFCAIIS